MSEDFAEPSAAASGPPPAPAPRPSALPGMLMGCGGCGCLFTFVALVVGIILFAIGVEEREEEIQIAGAITGGAALLLSVGALVLLIVGIVKNRGLKAAYERYERGE